MTATTEQLVIDVPAVDEAAIGAFAERIFMAAIGAFELATVELGMRLGLYEALADGPATPPALVARAGIDCPLRGGNGSSSRRRPASWPSTSTAPATTPTPACSRCRSSTRSA